MRDEIFRFMLLRPPQRQSAANEARYVIRPYKDELSAFASRISQVSTTPEIARREAKDFIRSSEYVDDLRKLQTPIASLDDWFLGHQIPDIETLRDVVQEFFHVTLEEIVSSMEFQEDFRQLADSLLAVVVSGLPYVRGQERLTRGIQIWTAISHLAISSTTISEIENKLRGIVVLPRLIKQANMLRTTTASRVSLSRRQADLKIKQNELDTMQRAVKELGKLFDYQSLSQGATGDNALDGNQTKVGYLTTNDFHLLTDETRQMLKRLGLDGHELFIPSMVQFLEKDLALRSTELYVISADSEMSEAESGPVSYVPETKGRVRVAGIGDLDIVRQRVKRYELGEIAYIENVLRGESYTRNFQRKESSEESELEESETIQFEERDIQSTTKSELKSEAEKTVQEDIQADAGVNVTASGPVVEVSAEANFSYERSNQESTKTASSFAREVVDRSVSRLQTRVLKRRTSRTLREIDENAEHVIDNTKDTTAEDHMIGIYRWVDKIYEAQVVKYDKRMILEFIVPEPAAFYRYANSRKPIPGITMKEPQAPVERDGSVERPLTVQDIVPGKYLKWVGEYNLTNVKTPPPLYKFIAASLKQEDMGSDHKASAVILEDGKLKVPSGYQATVVYQSHTGVVEGATLASSSIAVGNHISSGESSSYSIQPLDNNIPAFIHTSLYSAFAVNLIVLCVRTDEEYKRWQMEVFNSIMNKYEKLKAEYDDQVAANQVQGGIGENIQGRNPLANREIERNELRRLSISMITGQNFDLFNAMVDGSISPHYPQIENFEEAEVEGNYIQFIEQAFEWKNMTYVFYPYYWGRKANWVDITNLDDVDPLFAQFLRAGSARVNVPVRPGFGDAVIYFLQHGKPWLGGDPPTFEDTEVSTDDLEDGEPVPPPYVSILQELREQTGEEFTIRPGTVRVTPGSTTVKGIGTNFHTIDDVDREIRIEGKVHRIRLVNSEDELTLWSPYQGEMEGDFLYSIGPVLVGQPWEVRLPTTLVKLQESSELPLLGE